jgi:hypothetical protein
VKIDVSSHAFDRPREEVFPLLVDPAVLARLLPGVEKLEETAPNQYAVAVKLGVGAIRGSYTGKVELLDVAAPERFRLRGEAKGGPGFAKGQATLTLRAEDAGTRIHASADLQVGGAIATVGQRMLEGVAKSMANEFFQSLERELAGHAPAKTSAAGFGWRVFLDLVRRFFARLFGR